MKKVISKIILLSAFVAISACNNIQPSRKESESGRPDITLFTDEPASDSSEPITSQNNDSSAQSSSSDTNTSSGPQMRTDELYLENGLSIKFKAQGARIDKINYKGKQIAKDGFVVGRCANRIAAGKCTIDGVQYNLTKNNNGNHLHGGGNSWQGPFATKNWTKVEQTFSSITYSIHSNDGEEGYPGNMDMTVKYTLTDDGMLTIEYSATTDKATLCNPTNHLFMAVNGNNSYNNIRLWVDADNYTPLSNSIPTGEIKSVEGTQFDYRTEKAFDGSKNYDDNLCLNGEGYRRVACLKGTSLGVSIDVYTDRPGLQLYKDGSGNICLETQMYPDAINQANFTDPILRPDQPFYSKTAYLFGEIEN